MEMRFQVERFAIDHNRVTGGIGFGPQFDHPAIDLDSALANNFLAGPARPKIGLRHEFLYPFFHVNDLFYL